MTRSWIVGIMLAAIAGGSNRLAADDGLQLGCRRAAHGAAAEADGPPHYAPDRLADVLHMKIDVTPDWTAKTVAGTTTITFAPLGRPLKTLRLDAVDLAISAIRSSEPIADYAVDREHVTIAFESPVPVGRRATVSIDHSAQPKMGFYFRTPDMGYPEGDAHVWTQGETHEARHWFPCYDYPNERSTTEVICRVPPDMTVVSNGRLVSETVDPESGLKAVRWVMDKPHATYLVCLVAGHLKKLEARHGDTPLGFYTQPSLFPYAENSFADAVDIMDFFEKEIGVPYPWNKYDQATVADPSFGGMENTTLTTLTQNTIFTKATENIRTTRRLAAHEMAHQWFGDYVTCKDWSHLWLNEGFATYYTHLYEEHRFGRDALLYGLYRDARGRVLPNSGDPRPIVYRDYERPSEQFDWRAYPKGGWVLHMLRSQLGVDLYRRCIRTYLERHALSSVVTEDLNRVLEELTGRSWDPFFDQWLYHAGNPRLKVSYRWLPADKMAHVVVEQTQETNEHVLLFQFPTKLRFILPGRTVDRDIRIDRRRQEFYTPLPQRPEIVRFDPEYTVLADVAFDKPDAMLAAQVRREDDVIGRLLAVAALAKRKTNQAVELLRERLQRDPFYGVRVEAAGALRRIGDKRARQALAESLDQPDARVRLEVVQALGGFYHPETLARLEQILEQEKNPAIQAAAVRALGRFDPQTTRPLILRFLRSTSFRNELADAAVAAIAGQRDPAYAADLLSVLRDNERAFTTQGLASGLQTLGRVSSRLEDKTAVRRFLLKRLDHPKRRVVIAACRALGSLGDPAAAGPLEALAAGDEEDPVAKAAREALESLDEQTPLAPGELTALRRAVRELQAEQEELRRELDQLKKKEAAKR